MRRPQHRTQLNPQLPIARQQLAVPWGQHLQPIPGDAEIEVADRERKGRRCVVYICCFDADGAADVEDGGPDVAHFSCPGLYDEAWLGLGGGEG